jgi:hypothetical protein
MHESSPSLSSLNHSAQRGRGGRAQDRRPRVGYAQCAHGRRPWRWASAATAKAGQKKLVTR